jgi:hypothetical protein
MYYWKDKSGIVPTLLKRVVTGLRELYSPDGKNSRQRKIILYFDDAHISHKERRGLNGFLGVQKCKNYLVARI